MTNVVGYARVSRRDQNPAAQEAELLAAGAVRVFVDHGESSRVTDRPQWLACLDYLRDGDTLLVRRLDRLGGTERIIIETLHDLDRRGVNIKSRAAKWSCDFIGVSQGDAVLTHGVSSVRDARLRASR